MKTRFPTKFRPLTIYKVCTVATQRNCLAKIVAEIYVKLIKTLQTTIIVNTVAES